MINFINAHGFSNTMDYDKMLSRGRKSLPKSIFDKERFEIPKVLGHIEGNKTVISNFTQIADVLSRPAETLLKYIQKELATPGVLKAGRLILGTKVPASRINEKIRNYANLYVFCPNCGKPDTKIEKEGNVSFLKCTACGAKNPVRA